MTPVGFLPTRERFAYVWQGPSCPCSSLSHVLYPYLRRFLERLFSPRFTIMNEGGMGFTTDGILGTWLEGGNETIMSNLMPVTASGPIYPPPASPTACSLTNLEDFPFWDITDDLASDLPSDNNENAHRQTPTTSNASFSLENDFDIEGFDNGFLDSNALHLDDDMFGADYIGTMDISAFSDFVVLVSRFSDSQPLLTPLIVHHNQSVDPVRRSQRLLGTITSNIFPQLMLLSQMLTMSLAQQASTATEVYRNRLTPWMN